MALENRAYNFQTAIKSISIPKEMVPRIQELAERLNVRGLSGIVTTLMNNEIAKMDIGRGVMR